MKASQRHSRVVVLVVIATASTCHHQHVAADATVPVMRRDDSEGSGSLRHRRELSGKGKTKLSLMDLDLVLPSTSSSAEHKEANEGLVSFFDETENEEGLFWNRLLLASLSMEPTKSPVSMPPVSIVTPLPTIRATTLAPTTPNTPSPSTSAPITVTSSAPSGACPTGSTPTAASAPVACAPTTGPCHSTRSALQATLDNTPTASTVVVSICGGSTINTTTNGVVQVSIPPSTTEFVLCCAAEDCLFQNTGDSSPNLSITTTASTTTILSDLKFEGGYGSGFNGGNLAIQTGGGSVIISNSTFTDGSSGNFGGNVYIENGSGMIDGRVHIFSSTFQRGQAGQWGGGALVLNVETLVVQDSIFRDNVASIGAGLMPFWESNVADLSQEGQDIEIVNSVFDNNSGEGGILSSNLGSMPKLTILHSTFSANAGPAGLFCCSSEYNLTLCGNQDGGGNTNSGNPSCPGFDFFDFCQDITDVVGV